LRQPWGMPPGFRSLFNWTQTLLNQVHLKRVGPE
jgi:hypothetical protein